MRAATLPILALPLLFTYCGSKGDLIIGELSPVVVGGGSVIPSGGSSAPNAGGSTPDSGGSATDDSNAGSKAAGQGGATDDAATGTPCIDGEQPPLDSLLHRYSFNGTGTNVVDSSGGADGSLVGGAMLDGSGVLTLPGEHDGQADQYLNLPNGLVSSLSEVTVVAWTTWAGGAGYQRVFDFGISDLGERQGNSGKSYIAVMPSTGFANGTGLGAEVAVPGFATVGLGSAEDMLDRPAQVAFAVRSGISLELFLDGKSLIQSPTPVQLTDIKDINDFVGESQWSKDHAYHGTYDELRIYSAALNACQLRTLFDRGPDTP
jgi:Concanavalin A-like lectin/glucanases superfamily